MITENAKSRWINDFNNGVSLSFAPASIQDNKELVMIAVGLNGMNLKFASERLKNDMDVVLLAINQDVEYLKYADKNLQSLIILKAKTFVSTNEYGYYYLQSNNSITRNFEYEKEVKKSKDLLKHYDNMLKKIQEYKITEESKDLVKRYYTNVLILKANDLKGKDLEKYISEIKVRKLYKNIKPYNLKQLLKRILLKFNVKMYLKRKGEK